MRYDFAVFAFGRFHFQNCVLFKDDALILSFFGFFAERALN